jgi:uncharacterized membrane protein
MAATTNSKPVSPLAEYLVDVLHQRWSSDRSDLETKWEQNDCTIRRIRQINWKEGEGEDWRANNAIGFVKQKWMTGCALVLDHILQGGTLNAGLKVDELGQELSQEELDGHTDDINQAERHLRTQFALGRIDRPTIKAVFAGGKYGMAWGQYYVDEIERVEWQPVQYDFAPEDPADQRFEQVTHAIDVPMVEWVPCWEMFWDMTEDDILKGDGLCREQNISAYQLRDYADRGEGWIPKEIEAVIQESKTSEKQGEADDDNIAPGRRYIEYSKNNIKFRQFHCRIPIKILQDYDKKYMREKAPDFDGGFSELSETDGREKECLVVVANNVVVRYLPMDSARDNRKFYYVKWEDDLDHDPGVGIADNGYQVQEILNGAFNAFQDNKKLVGDVQGFYNPLHFKDDDSMAIEPGKFRPTTEAVKNINDAVMQLTFEDTGQSLLDVIRLTQEFMDDETNIPKMAQGAVGPVTPNTAYEAQQMMEKSGKYIAGVITNYDNGWTEPITRDYFEYNMMDPNSTTGKGNYVAIAKGFTSYQDKVVRVQKLMQVLNMALSSPTMENMVRVMKLVEEVLKANDIDPDEVLYTEEEYRENQMRQAQMEQQGSEEDAETKALDNEKTAAEIREIEREQDRKDEELEIKKRENLADTKGKANDKGKE